MAKVHYINLDIDKDDEKYIDIESVNMKKYNEKNNNIIIQLDKPKFGDFVEDCSNSGYRMGGVYIITKSKKGDLYIKDLDTEVDDYGHVGKGFSLGTNFPTGYWKLAIDKNAKNAYWHDSDQGEPLAKHTWGKIKINNLIQSKRKVKIYKKNNYNKYEEVEENQDYCDINYKWGILRFSGNKEEVINKLNILKNKIPKQNLLYFVPIINDNKDSNIKYISEIADYEWNNE